MTAVPAARWTAEQAAAARPLSEREAACVRHGGFVARAERFDGRFFGAVCGGRRRRSTCSSGCSLEHGYEALHGAALTRASLLGSATAVFVGLERPDWALRRRGPPSAAPSVFGVTADAASIASGRLPFAGGLARPCASIDTACSSSVVAAARRGDARAAASARARSSRRR